MKLKNVIITTFEEYINEQKEILEDYIQIDGVTYSTKNSNGNFISTDINFIINFYKWFDKSKTVDDNQRPIVYYHISNKIFNVFTPSIFGKMGEGIYFTSILSDITKHNKYAGGKIYSCYLKIENPLEIETPFSKRNDNNDGIIAFKGKSGEEIKVYRPNQIKSIDNDGSFDIFDDNIYS